MSDDYALLRAAAERAAGARTPVTITVEPTGIMVHAASKDTANTSSAFLPWHEIILARFNKIEDAVKTCDARVQAADAS